MTEQELICFLVQWMVAPVTKVYTGSFSMWLIMIWRVKLCVLCYV